LKTDAMTAEVDQRIADAIGHEQARLRNFIRRRVPDPADVEDVLQDVFCELVEAYQLTVPIQQVSAWLFRVARNRITDLFRKRKPEWSLDQPGVETEEGDILKLEDLLPARDGSPEASYARTVLLAELEDALDELPREQREVFVAHEIEGRSFKELSAASGVSVNTLLSRKHYAVMHLRDRLRRIYEEYWGG